MDVLGKLCPSWVIKFEDDYLLKGHGRLVAIIQMALWGMYGVFY